MLKERPSSILQQLYDLWVGPVYLFNATRCIANLRISYTIYLIFLDYGIEIYYGDY